MRAITFSAVVALVFVALLFGGISLATKRPAFWVLEAVAFIGLWLVLGTCIAGGVLAALERVPRVSLLARYAITIFAVAFLALMLNLSWLANDMSVTLATAAHQSPYSICVGGVCVVFAAIGRWLASNKAFKRTGYARRLT